jgi:uncharacterized protein
MNKKSAFALAVAAAFSLAGHAHAQFVISEIESDTFNTPSTDYGEFIEIFSLSGTTTLLDGLTLVLINGNGDVSYRAMDLDGLSTDANGYFVFGTTAISGADDTSFLGAGNLLQNGQDAVGLYSGDAINFPNGTAATTTGLIDVIVYGTDDPDDTGLLAALGETVQYNEGPNPGSDAANMSLSRFPGPTDEFVLTTPTPGTANVPEPSSIALLGFGALVGLGRRRQRQA